jgi:hypothetical protein
MVRQTLARKQMGLESIADLKAVVSAAAKDLSLGAAFGNKIDLSDKGSSNAGSRGGRGRGGKGSVNAVAQAGGAGPRGKCFECNKTGHYPRSVQKSSAREHKRTRPDKSATRTENAAHSRSARVSCSPFKRTVTPPFCML